MITSLLIMSQSRTAHEDNQDRGIQNEQENSEDEFAIDFEYDHDNDYDLIGIYEEYDKYDNRMRDLLLRRKYLTIREKVGW